MVLLIVNVNDTSHLNKNSIYCMFHKGWHSIMYMNSRHNWYPDLRVQSTQLVYEYKSLISLVHATGTRLNEFKLLFQILKSPCTFHLK